MKKIKRNTFDLLKMDLWCFKNQSIFLWLELNILDNDWNQATLHIWYLTRKKYHANIIFIFVPSFVEYPLLVFRRFTVHSATDTVKSRKPGKHAFPHECGNMQIRVHQEQNLSWESLLGYNGVPLVLCPVHTYVYTGAMKNNILINYISIVAVSRVINAPTIIELLYTAIAIDSLEVVSINSSHSENIRLKKKRNDLTIFLSKYILIARVMLIFFFFHNWDGNFYREWRSSVWLIQRSCDDWAYDDDEVVNKKKKKRGREGGEERRKKEDQDHYSIGQVGDAYSWGINTHLRCYCLRIHVVCLVVHSQTTNFW